MCIREGDNERKLFKWLEEARANSGKARHSEGREESDEQKVSERGLNVKEGVGE